MSNKIIVYSLPRSGTNYLMDTLQKSINNCFNLGEFLHHSKDFIRNIPQNIANPDEACFVLNSTHNYNVDIEKINKIFDHFNNYENVLIKIQQWGLYNILLRHKLWFHEISKNSTNLYLIRNDLIDSVISKMVAEKTKAYTLEQELSALQKTPNLLEDFKYDYQTMKTCHIDIINCWKWLDKNKPKNSVKITYENILSYDSDDWKYIKRLFKINEISKESWFKKQDKTKFQEWKRKYIDENKNELPIFHRDIKFYE
jgi:hypothetical protein